MTKGDSKKNASGSCFTIATLEEARGSRLLITMPVPNVQVVQPQPEADQPLAEHLHARFKAFGGSEA
jgi:hypothetical protein